METPLWHDLIPGARLEGDWYHGAIPPNIVAGKNTRVDSSACFKYFRATGSVGLRTGEGVTIWRTSFSPEENGFIEIGDHSWIGEASLACTTRIVIGKRVFIAGGVTIADSDFHPLAPGARLFDSVAVSMVGDRSRRPLIEARPVVIEDDVWIGFGATILKGVRIGAGAVVSPAAVVTTEVSPGCVVAGSPASVVEDCP